MMKSLARLSLGLGMVLAASAILLMTDQPRPRAGTGTAPARRWKVGLVCFSDSTVVDEAREGLRAGLDEAGLVDARDYTIAYHNAQGDIATLNSTYDELNSDDTDLIVSFSTPALQSGLRKVDRKPLVFGVVLDPFAAGAGKSDVDHRPNVSGVYLDFHYAEMVETIRQVLPGARRVGSLFTPGEVNSVVARDHFEEALRKGRLELVCLPVNAGSEVSDAALALCRSRIDVFCQLSDSLSNSSFPAIVRACDGTNTRLFAFASTQVNNGAILAVGADYSDNGRDAGLLAAEVVRGRDPSKIAFRKSTKVRRAVNLDTARHHGLTIPSDWIRKADLVLPRLKK
jgi:ABC-type uncharacterized transport system substrate-binding protein